MKPNVRRHGSCLINDMAAVEELVRGSYAGSCKCSLVQCLTQAQTRDADRVCQIGGELFVGCLLVFNKRPIDAWIWFSTSMIQQEPAAIPANSALITL